MRDPCLAGVVHPNGATATYAYDAAGNRTRVTATTGAVSPPPPPPPPPGGGLPPWEQGGPGGI